jgi:hypothetical protein
MDQISSSGDLVSKWVRMWFKILGRIELRIFRPFTKIDRVFGLGKPFSLV